MHVTQIGTNRYQTWIHTFSHDSVNRRLAYAIVSADDVFYLFLTTLSVLASITIFVALRKMRRVKRTTIVFLANLALSIFVQGIAFAVNTFLHVSDAFNERTCLVWVIVFVTPSAHYITGLLFIYLDLYASLRKMAVGRPPISARLAVGMSSASLLFWTALCSVGFRLPGDGYAYSSRDGCSFIGGVVAADYVLMVVLAIGSVYAAIVLLIVLVHRLVPSAHRRLIRVEPNSQFGRGTTVAVVQTISERRSTRTMRAAIGDKWMKKNTVVLKTVTLMFVVLTVTWCLVVVLYLIVVYCHSCRSVIYKEVIYVTYILIAVQHNSNGVIYLVKIKELRDSCTKLCCRCASYARRVSPEQTTDSEIVST